MAHTPESVKWQQSQLPKEAIEDAEKFVEENFKGLSDFIEDADILIWYKALIVSAITDYQYKPKQEVIDQDKKGFTYPTQGIKPQKEYWQPSGNIPNSNWQPDTIEKQVSERIAGYIHEIDSLRGTIRELVEKIKEGKEGKEGGGGKQLYEFVKAKIDYLKSIELTKFGEGRLNAYEEIEEGFEPITIEQGNSDDKQILLTKVQEQGIEIASLKNKVKELQSDYMAVQTEIQSNESK